MSVEQTTELPKGVPRVQRPPEYKKTPPSDQQRAVAIGLMTNEPTIGGEKFAGAALKFDSRENDPYIESEMKKMIKAAAEKKLPNADDRAKNIQAIVSTARSVGIDMYDLADELVNMGEDPRAYIADLPSDEPAAAIVSDVARAAPIADVRDPEETAEQMGSPEKRARLKQEAYAIGRRIVNTEIVQHTEDNGAAGAYDVLNRLQPNDFAAGGKFEHKPITLSPSVKPTESSATENLPQITVSLQGKEGSVGVKQILGISVSTDGQKVAKISYKRIAENGTISTGTLENVAMQDILNGQVLAEEARLSSLLSGDMLVAFKAYTAALRGGENADAAFADIPAMENALKGAAQAVGMLTSADVAAYVANIQAQLPRDEQGAMSPEAAGENRRLEALKAKTAEVVLVGPDVLQDITLEGLNIDPTQLKDQLATATDGVASAKKEIDDLIRTYQGPDKSEKIKDAERALDLAMRRKTELQVISVAAETAQNDSLASTLEGYFGRLTSGEVALEDARTAIDHFREGDYIGFLNEINPIPEQGENESATAYAMRMQAEENRRKNLLKVGSGAGILVLILASITSSLVNPQ